MRGYRKYYSRDLKWIVAKFNSTGPCGHKIEKGQEIFYYPADKSAYCPECSKERSAEFEAAAMDEDVFVNASL